MQSSTQTIGAVLLALAFLLVLQGALARDEGQRNLEIFTEMAYSAAGESYAAWPGLAGGLVLQAPVPGAVVRGTEAFPYAATPEDAKRAGEEVLAPVSADPDADLRRGGELFAIYCTVCHDPAGDGLGPVVLRGMVQPPSLHADNARLMKDGQMFHVLTRGQGNMASYAGQLSVAERWQVIAWVRALQGGKGS